MNPLLISGALSLVGKAVDYVQERQAAAAAAPSSTSSVARPFATELAATQKTRLQSLTTTLSQLPGVQAAMAAHPGQPVQLNFPSTGGMTVQVGSNPAVAVALDSASAPLAAEARALLSGQAAGAQQITLALK